MQQFFVYKSILQQVLFLQPNLFRPISFDVSWSSDVCVSFIFCSISLLVQSIFISIQLHIKCFVASYTFIVSPNPLSTLLVYKYSVVCSHAPELK